MIGLELHLGDFRTRTLIPGLDSANEVIIGGAGQGLDLAGRIGDYGVKFNVGRDYSIGAGGALRTLIDLGMIEMVGKWARVPYWQCLTLEQTHPDFQRQMRDWFDEGSPLVHNKLVQRSMMSQGYLAAGDQAADQRSPEMISALGKFQADSGLAVTGVVDFATYERALRDFVSLNANGQLRQVGWSSASGAVSAAAGTATSAVVATSGTQAISGSPYLKAALGAPALPRRLELQLENPLVGRPAFEVGEQIFLSASLSRASYLYCFLHEAGGTVMRLLPNVTNPSALISASNAIRIPDWMSPTPGFIMDATSAGTERVGCYATDTEVADKLPAILAGTALAAIKGVANLQSIDQAFDTLGSNQPYTTAKIQWLVAPKAATPAVTPAPASPPGGAAK